MCLAIYQPAGKQIPESHLFEGFKSNPHGAGFMCFDEDGKLFTFKSMDFKEFADEYERMWALHGSSSPFSIHFRYATHGRMGVQNAHPFRLGEHVAVLHNGIIDCNIADPEMSDTAAFVQDYLGALPRNWQDNDNLFHMVEDFTHGSKLVLMTDDPEAQYCAYIINEKSGLWEDGVWYSNTSFSCPKPRGFVSYGMAELSAQVFEQEELYPIDKCEMCGEESVLDGVCYTCESCQQCYMTEQDCNCGTYASLHALTNEQFAQHYSE